MGAYTRYIINKGIPSLVPRSFPAQRYCKQGEAGKGPENEAELFPQHLWVRPLWFSALCLLSHANLPWVRKFFIRERNTIISQ